MKIGSQADRNSAISASNAESIVVRGHDLCRDLVGHITFTDHAWLLVTGRLPTPAQRRILDATLVAIAEHGLVPSVAAARMEDPSVKGNQAPLVSKDTANIGAQYSVPVGGLNLSFRADYRYTGETWWEPYNITSRDPISLLDGRISLGGERWSATLWGKNLTDEKYNQEFSPGGFLFKALPIRYGIEFDYSF